MLTFKQIISKPNIKNRKMPKTTSILKISKNKKNAFFLMFQGPLKQKIRFLAQKMCPVARGQTNNSQTNNSQTDTKAKTEATLSGFQDSVLSTYD